MQALVDGSTLPTPSQGRHSASAAREPVATTAKPRQFPRQGEPTQGHEAIEQRATRDAEGLVRLEV